MAIALSAAGLEAVEAALERYAAWEPTLRAFAWCEPEQVLARARRARGRRGGAVLAGMPVGVKDVFDTAGIQTEYGSQIFAGRVPRRSALAVRRLEEAGAVVLGKTVTSELAYYEPGPTTNPWDPTRTPGGSSMGSAAAVAAGVVPGAIGTQTNGSVIRPAAFCGVVGFKPTFGRLPRAGMLRFSPSLDQPGVFARSVAGAARLAAVLAGEAPDAWLPARPSRRRPMLGVVRSPEWREAEPAMRACLDAALEQARAAGATVCAVDLPERLGAALPVHRAIMAAEANRVLGPLVAGRVVSAQLRELLDEGAAIAPAAYDAARRVRRRLIAEQPRWASGVDAIVTLAALGEAPSPATTGDPRCCTRWSLLGAPALALPAGLGPNSLPLAVQLVGVRGRDRELLQAAAWLERALPPIGSPPSPGVSRPG